QRIDLSEKPADTTAGGFTNEQVAALGVHPNILLVRWEIHSRKGEWLAAFQLAESLVAALPTEPIGWIYSAFALQQLGLLQQARQHLLDGARRCPADWRIAYNLACYASRLGDLAGAWNWLDKAMELGDAAAI